MSKIEIKDRGGTVLKVVEGEDLRYADLRGADLTGTILEGLKIGEVRGT